MHATQAPSRSDPADLATELTAFVNFVMHRAGGAKWLEVVDDVDLSLTQLKALVALRGEEELTVKDLGAALSLSVAATSRAIDGLLHRGLVERREDEQDRRMKRVRLSRSGRTVLGRVSEARTAGIEAFVGTLTPSERRGLADGLAPIASRYRPAGSSPEGS